jgi:hypothetical protein
VFTLLSLSPMTEAVSVSFCSVSAENLRKLYAEDYYIDNILRVNEIRALAMNGGFIEPAIPQVGQVQPLNAVL